MGVSIIVGILAGIVSSIIASYIFLYHFLTKKVPIIEISDYISKKVHPDDSVEYRFKIVNKTNAPVYDVTLDAYFLTPTGSDGGQNLLIEVIKVNNNTYTHVPCKKKNDNNALHAVQVRCNDKIEEKWSNPSMYLRLEVIGKHEISGFSKVFVKDFHSKNIIKNGQFKFGNNLEIT